MTRRNSDIQNRRWDEWLTGRMELYALKLQYRVALAAWIEVNSTTPVYHPKRGDPPNYPKKRGGRLKFGWLASFEAPSSDGPAGSQGAARNKAEATLRSATSFHLIWFTNNVVYMQVIEYGLYPNPPKHGTGRTSGGYSTQAPKGVVRESLKVLPIEVPKIARALFQEMFG